MRDYERVYSKVYNYLHNLTFGQFQNTTINVRGAMNCATTNAFKAGTIGECPRRDSLRNYQECKRRYELRDYERVYSKVYNYLHNLTFGQFQNTTINVRGAMNCATTNAANPKESV